MCGRFDTTHLSWREIHERLSGLGRVTSAPLNLQPDDDVRPTTDQAVARWDGEGFSVEKMRWGLVPFWRDGKPLKDTAKGKGDGFKPTTFNCRSEGVAGSAVFKGAFARRRALAPASAWYEWTGPAGSKARRRFERADGAPLWFAALWDECETPDAGRFRSFTILTAPSAGWLSDYHDRQPVVLEPADWARWLDPRLDPRPLFADPRPERFVLSETTGALSLF
jgi:putative SOS response-associated peptidase YedK